MSMPCNICGGTEFGPGPGGRRSTTGKLPYCVKCGTLERHRAFRQMFERLRDDDFADWTVLQFSGDRSNDPSWFAQHETSVYGRANSLDLMKVARDNDTYDLVVCNHVIEHVQYDNAAMAELVRIIKPTGIVFLTFPDAVNRAVTTEWAEPRADQHHHWRVYGRDVVDRFRRYIPMYGVYSAMSADPVTEAGDLIFFLTKSAVGTRRLKRMIPELETINEPPAFRG